MNGTTPYAEVYIPLLRDRVVNNTIGTIIGDAIFRLHCIVSYYYTGTPISPVGLLSSEPSHDERYRFVTEIVE